MKETNHDYQGGICGNFFNSKETTRFHLSWDDFKKDWYGFKDGKIKNYDDAFHFLFRYDIEAQKDNKYTLVLANMLQRKGIYSLQIVQNVTQEELDGEVKEWLKGRKEYMDKLWAEVSEDTEDIEDVEIPQISPYKSPRFEGLYALIGASTSAWFWYWFMTNFLVQG